MLKKNTFFNTSFSWFFVVLISENEAEIEYISIFFENVDFVKIVLPSRREHDFWGSALPKNNKMRSRNALEKKVKKNVVKIDFGFHFACQKLPPNPQNLQKSTKIALKKKL